MNEVAAWLLAIGLGSVVWIGVTVLDHYLQRRRDELEKELADRNDRRCHERKKAYQQMVAEVQRRALEIQHQNQMKYLDRIEEINDGPIPGDEWKH